MRLVFNNFQSLMSTLSDITVVSDDSYNDDSLKSIIFKIAKAEDGQSDKVSILGVNALITMDKSIEPSEFDCTCDVSEMNEQKLFIFQISSKNLMAFLNAYKSSRRTTVKSITFENEGGKISCTIVEIDKVTNTSSMMIMVLCLKMMNLLSLMQQKVQVRNMFLVECFLSFLLRRHIMIILSILR